MRAFHTLWTKPFFVQQPTCDFAFEDFDLLTMVLSAALWQLKNGPIDLYTDRIGFAYLQSLDLLPLWDQVFPILDEMNPSIDADCFWAAGKLFALRAADTPCVMLDTDFIVWEDLTSMLDNTALAVIHREPLAPEIYPDPHILRTARGFDLAPFDLTQPAANTALAFFRDPAFRDAYANTALDFMTDAQPNGDRLTYMVFAEQRLLPMMAAQRGVPLTALSDLAALFFSGQTLFTHTWGYKNVLRADPAERTAFCSRCIARLQRDFPSLAALLRRIRGLESYFV